jgi:hypothetical protein
MMVGPAGCATSSSVNIVELILTAAKSHYIKQRSAWCRLFSFFLSFFTNLITHDLPKPLEETTLIYNYVKAVLAKKLNCLSQGKYNVIIDRITLSGKLSSSIDYDAFPSLPWDQSLCKPEQKLYSSV